MRPHELEAKVLDIIDRVVAGQQVEDDLVELKAEWPSDTAKAARRLAGHANVARGEPILWIVGVDEAARVVTGVENADPASWWTGVSCHFDAVVPRLSSLAVAYSGKTVAALRLETDRAPFVVKNPAFGASPGTPVEFEVPWRDGTRIRTARREDLIRILVPAVRVPEAELLAAELELKPIEKDGSRLVVVEMELYLVPTTNQRCCIPFHRCRGKVKFSGEEWIDLPAIGLMPHSVWDVKSVTDISRRSLSRTVLGSDSELVLDGPGLATLRAEARVRIADGEEAVARLTSGPAEVRFFVGVVGSSASIEVSATMNAPRESTDTRWRLGG